jgi:hypothetical protein
MPMILSAWYISWYIYALMLPFFASVNVTAWVVCIFLLYTNGYQLIRSHTLSYDMLSDSEN